MPKDDNLRNGTQCTGTRISKHYVLAAAHCVGLSKTVVFGNGAVAKIKRQTPHPSWKGQEDDNYEFIVIELADPVPDGPVAQLPSSPLMQGDLLWVAGGGYTHSGGDGVLHKTMIGVTDPNFTSTQSRTLGRRLANGKKSGICGGDSGGGSFMIQGGRLTLVGVNVTSSEDIPAYSCGNDVYIGNVFKVKSWILSLIKEP